MPAVLREGPYRFFFYAGDRDEPKHIHVARDNQIAKFWLEPVRLEMSGGLIPISRDTTVKEYNAWPLVVTPA